MVEDVYVAVGSNINPQDNISRALLALKTYFPINAVSNFYKTPALDRPSQADFINGVVRIQTGRSPREIKFDVLRNIEACLGRIRCADKYAPRTIDLDMILYGTEVIDEPDLRLPDPSIRLYPFVAVPLLELDPELILPDTQTSLSAEPVARPAADTLLLPEFTESLRRLILA